MDNKFLPHIFSLLQKRYQVVSIFNSRILGYSLLAYIVFAAHHFFPVLYSLYTFQNCSILVAVQIVLFVTYQKGYFYRVFRIYIQYISLYFRFIAIALSVILFVGVFLFYVK